MKELDERIQELEKRDRNDAKKNRKVSTHDLGRLIIKGLQEKKGSDITVMDVSEVSGVTDYFVICTGESPRQVKALADAVRESVKTTSGEYPWHTEGYENKEWVLMDYVDVVVHVFSPSRRSFYDLERLWADAPVQRLEGEDVEAEFFKD